MKNLVWILFLVIIFFSCIDRYQKAQEFTLKGFDLLTNNPHLALVYFNKAIKLDKNLIKAYEGKALCFKKLSDREALKKILEEILKLDKKNKFAIEELGYIYFEESNYENAFEILKSNIENEAFFNSLLDILINIELKKTILEMNYNKLYEYYIFQNREKEASGKEASAIFLLLDYIEKRSNTKNENEIKRLKEILDFAFNEIEKIKPDIESDSLLYIHKGYEMAEMHGDNLFETHQQMYDEFIKTLKAIYAFYYLQNIKIDEKQEVIYTINRAKIFYYKALNKKLDKVKKLLKIKK